MINTSKPSIVVVAYNRPLSLKRLLNSLKNADYSDHRDINLIISIDKSDIKEVVLTAIEFDWAYGKKTIIEHDTKLGLRKHIISCGDLTNEYDSVIILEDDLFVSPQFYLYCIQSLLTYNDDPKIAGISLYAYRINEISNLFFLPIEDGWENYFIQFASSWGQIWTTNQWECFKNWYEKNQIISDFIPIPTQVRKWSEQSWKKFYIAYLVETNKYFVFPRISLTTNFSSDAGTHLSQMPNDNFQVPLLLKYKNLNFSKFNESLAVYDSYFEIKAYCIKKLNPFLEKYDFECDLYGMKSDIHIKTPFLISTRNCSKPILNFGLHQIPLELNIIFNVQGEDCYLGQKEHFSKLGKIKFFKIAAILHYRFRLAKYFYLFFIALLDRVKNIWSK
ncbi:MAG TPA: glycosyltransferase [Candidatus Paceibacterota bacterium]